MAVKTMTAKTGGGGKFDDGWHELTISKAEYGTYTATTGDLKYITLSFENYPDNMDLRIYEAFVKKTGEEFKVASLFKMANAGIMGVLKDPSGKNPVIQYDDEAENLIGKKVNVLFYKETKSGKGYTRMHDLLAPVVQEGEHLSYAEDKVEGIKKGVENSLKKKLENMTPNTGFATANVETTETTSTEMF